MSGRAAARVIAILLAMFLATIACTYAEEILLLTDHIRGR